MRLGNALVVAAADAPSSFVAGSMASSAGKAKAVPKPLKKLRRGSCHLFRMTLLVAVN